MAVLQKIRVKFGLAISIIIALALLSFIIDPSTLESALHSMSSKYDVGLIAGKSISYTDFQEETDRFTTIYQMMTGSSSQNEQGQKQIRDAVWQDLIDKYMFVESAKKAGVVVGKEELNDLITGSNVSPIVSSNPVFAGEDGAFSADNVRNFVQGLSSDQSGQLRLYWNYLQNGVLNQQYHVKYNAMFSKSAGLNKLQKVDMVSGNNNTFDLEYVLSEYPMTDSTIVVSDKEIRKYYDTHKKQYKQDNSRDIEYVVFEVVPSVKDITAVNEEMTGLIDEFASTDNMKTFLLKNSEKSLSSYWYAEGELSTESAEIEQFVSSGSKGATSPIYKDGDVFRSVRIMDEAMVPDSAYVKHILVQGTNAKLVADTVMMKLRSGESFSGLAAQYSIDKNSADKGELGNIGWMTQSYIIPGFESVITEAVNKPFVLTTKYGTHVVVVTAKTKAVRKKQVAILEKTALPSNETFNEFYSKANNFATLANGSYEGYKKALDSTGVYSHPMSQVTEGTSSYGAVEQAKEVTRWIFDAKKGQVSNILTVNQNYFFIVTLKNINKEGYAPVENVSAGIRNILLQKKIEQKCKAEVAEKIAGKSSLQEIAEALGSSVNNTTGVSFMGGRGIEPALCGAASVAEPNKISGPVAGVSGIYVYTVSNPKKGAFYTEEDANNQETQKGYYMSQMIFPVMMEVTEVKDNRARFY